MTTALAPELGRLAAPSHAQQFDDIRLAMVDAIVVSN
jgi:hypothetical protein